MWNYICAYRFHSGQKEYKNSLKFNYTQIHLKKQHYKEQKIANYLKEHDILNMWLSDDIFDNLIRALFEWINSVRVIALNVK